MGSWSSLLPDRTAYSDDRDFQNPFHVRELTSEELVSMLRGRFANVRAWGQRLANGSMIWPFGGSPSDGDAVQRFIIERAGDDWRQASGITAMYAIAVASNGQIPDTPLTSSLVDAGDELVHMVQRAMASELATGDQLQSVRGELHTTSELLANERRLTAVMEDRAAGDQRTIVKLQAELVDLPPLDRGLGHVAVLPTLPASPLRRPRGPRHASGQAAPEGPQRIRSPDPIGGGRRTP